MVAAVPLLTGRTQADEKGEIELALSLAKMLQAGRSVISLNQDLINNAERGDKGLTGDVVLAATIEEYKKETSQDPLALDPASREARLLRAEMDAIREVVDESQRLINEQGLGFKGFIPAVFGRLVTERLKEKVPDELAIKVTAPPALVRNRKSRPDEWERDIIESKFLSPSWTHGAIFSQALKERGRDAFRVMVPEYYSTSCLSCHGSPKGEIGITGYPKEGASEGDLGGIISITLFRPNQ
jgi:hypothetical protein